MSDDRRLVHDRFEADVRRGRVIGSSASDGSRRGGRDRHRSFAVDHGALRIVSLPLPGWGTTALAYEPTESGGPAAFGVFAMNGHNTSQSEPLGESLTTRFKRWLKGNETETWYRHGVNWVLHGRRVWTLRRFTHWARVDCQSKRGTLLALDENLSVGFLPTVDADPTERGCSFLMHATGGDNGELWVATDGRTHPVQTSVPNVPLYLLVVKGHDRVVFLGGSIPGVSGLPPLPRVRPLAVFPTVGGDHVRPVVQQAVSGQIGFAADTRIWEAIVADVDAWLQGDCAPSIERRDLALDDATHASWTVEGGVGLVRVDAASIEALVGCEIGLRRASTDECAVGIDEDGWRFVRRRGDRTEVLATAPRGEKDRVELQITDDGRRIGVLNGSELVFGRWFEVDPADGPSHVVVSGPGRDGSRSSTVPKLDRIEVYPRELELPAPLQPSTQLVRPSEELRTIAVDEFEGSAGDLEGRQLGDDVWRRTFGDGRFELTGTGAVRVDASAADPAPGRIVYSVPTPATGPLELEIDVVAPGSGRGEGERGRAGLVFEQDADNALFVNTWLDDVYPGASVSSFFRLDGYEDLYDAIWSNVGTRIVWGRPYRLRVAFDGLVYEVFVDDELVLYRSLVDVNPRQERLRIARVGILANWEWGTDTGSTIRRWEIRGRDV